MPIMPNVIVGLHGFMEIYETHETLFMPNIKPDQVSKHA